MTNVDVRAAAMREGVRFWEIADYMGVSAETISRKLRKELSEAEKEKIFKIIKDIKKEGLNHGA